MVPCTLASKKKHNLSHFCSVLQNSKLSPWWPPNQGEHLTRLIEKKCGSPAGSKPTQCYHYYCHVTVTVSVTVVALGGLAISRAIPILLLLLRLPLLLIHTLLGHPQRGGLYKSARDSVCMYVCLSS